MTLKFIQFILPFHVAAWRASSEPIKQLLNAANPQLQNEATKLWRDTTQSQLNCVGITVPDTPYPSKLTLSAHKDLNIPQSALIGSVITSAFTWPYLQKLSVSSQNTVSAIWYSALILALSSIASSAQLAVALSRLSSHPDGLSKIRALLGRHMSDGTWKPRKLQLVIWQTPVSMLNASVMMFTVGFTVLVWKSVDWSRSWDDGAKVVSLFMVTLAYAVVLYFLSAFWLYYQLSRV